MPRWRHDRTGSGPDRQALGRSRGDVELPGTAPRPIYANCSAIAAERPYATRLAPAARPSAPIPRTRLQPTRTAAPRSDGWIGKVLAVAGVAVTLVGVVLLLVLAAQAGILRPEFRVARGAVLAVALVGAGWWLQRRPGGRVGAIALAATGIAAAYIDVIAVTTIYRWVPAPVGLRHRGRGRRRWPDAGAPVGLRTSRPAGAGTADRSRTRRSTDGVTLLLVGFMLALSAAALPVQLGKDWTWHARGPHRGRDAAAAHRPGLGQSPFWTRHLGWSGRCGIAALLAIAGALILLPNSSRSGRRWRC